MNAQPKDDRERVAIVTGASGGIGLGITHALLQRGYRVLATSRTISRSADLKASANLVLVDGDISKKDAAVTVADTAVNQFGRIDVLVNTAGIYISKPFTEYTTDDFDRMIATNIGGYFYITQQVVAQMRKQKSGHIVSISTVLTDQPLAGATTALLLLQNPRFQHSAAHWRWNLSRTGFEPTQFHQVSWTRRCTPTTTMNN